MRGGLATVALSTLPRFPFLFGGTFIEGACHLMPQLKTGHFPSFSEGLSLREKGQEGKNLKRGYFPSFSEGLSLRVVDVARCSDVEVFPFLFGGTFIEGCKYLCVHQVYPMISLPFRRDFH